jgi:hypothetical protein
MNKRVLILTGYTEMDSLNGHNFEDNPMIFKEVFDFCLSSKERYAAKHGYDFMCLRSFGKDPNGLIESSDTGRMRTVACLEMVKSYDYVFWIDGDSIITNDSFGVEDFADVDSEEIVYYASYDWPAFSKEQGLFGNGNYVVANNKNTDDLYEGFLSCTHSYENEQSTLNAMNKDRSYSKFFKILEHKCLNAAPAHEDILRKHQRHEIGGEWTDENFLCHFTGLKNDQRLYILNKYFSEYK